MSFLIRHLIILALFPVHVWGQCPNDECTDAIPLTLSGTSIAYSGSTLNATLSSTPDPFNSWVGNPLKDIWFSFVAPSSLELYISVNNNNDYYIGWQLLRGACQNLSVIENWSSLTEQTNPNATNIFLTQGETYYLRIMDESGLDNPIDVFGSIFFSCNEFTASITNPNSTIACAGQSISLNVASQSGAMVQWNNNGIEIPGATSTLFNAFQSGIYEAVLSLPNAVCPSISSNSISITIPDSAEIIPAGQSAICNGQPALLFANTGANISYQWSFNGTPINGQISPSIEASNIGIYGVTETYGSCISFDEIALSQGIIPTAPLILPDASLSVCNGNIVSINWQGSTIDSLNYQWTLNGNEIPNATSNNFSTDSSGTYCLLVSAPGGCVDTSNCLDVIDCVGFKSILLDEFKLFPNPADQFVHLKLSNSHQLVHVFITDFLGRIIDIQEIINAADTYQLPISQLANGAYMVHVLTDHSHIIEQFIKSSN